jgi:hypothetical protein
VETGLDSFKNTRAFKKEKVSKQAVPTWGFVVVVMKQVDWNRYNDPVRPASRCYLGIVLFAFTYYYQL